MRLIAFLISIATVIVVILGYEYLMKLVKKNNKKEESNLDETIDKEIDDYKTKSEKIKNLKEKINNIN
jgi:Tfp pilus assembly protein PilO